MPWTDASRLGENVRGYVRRLASGNGFRRLLPFSEAFGLAHLGPESDEQAWERLARVTRLARGDLEPMRWRSAGPPRSGSSGSLLVVLGSPIAVVFLCPTLVRFCPVCLVEDGYLRDFWCVAYVAACPKHGCLLVEECGACRRPLGRATRSRLWSCVCGRRFVDNPAVEAPDAAVRVTRNLAAIIGPAKAAGLSDGTCRSDLSPPFVGFAAQDYLAALHTLGVAATTPKEEDKPASCLVPQHGHGNRHKPLALPDQVRRLEAAVGVMDRWPGAYWSLLAEVAGRNTAAGHANPAQRAFATRIGRTLLNPLRGADGLPLAALQSEMLAFCAERLGAKRRARNLSTFEPVARRILAFANLSTISRTLGVIPQNLVLRRAFQRVLGELSADEAGAPKAELAELVTERTCALYGRAIASLSSSAAASALEGFTVDRRLVGWDHPDLLPPDPHLRGVHTDRVASYAPDAVQAALDRLSALAVRVPDAERNRPLVTVAEGLRRGAIKSWYTKTDFLLDVFSGTVPVFTKVEKPRLCDLRVDSAELKRRSDALHALRAVDGTAYVSWKRANTVAAAIYGARSSLAPGDYKRLSDSGIIRCRTRNLPRADRNTDLVRRLYHLSDVVAYAKARFAQEAETHGSDAAHDAHPDQIGMRKAAERSRPRVAERRPGHG